MAHKQSILKKIFHKSRRKIAKLYLNNFRSDVNQIAITGSYGKTTLTHFLYTILNNTDKTLRTDVNLDTIYNVPITALKLRDHKYIIFELGVDTIGEMDKHLEIVNPKISIINGIAPVHADEEHMGSLENIIKEKRKLIECLEEDEIAILNHNDEKVREMASKTKARVLFYGYNNECDYQISNLKINEQNVVFDLKTPKNDYKSIQLNVLGGHNAVNLAGIIACAEELGLSKEQILDGVAMIEPLKGRLNIEDGPLGIKLINDSLRSNTASARAGIEYLRNLKTESKKIMVLGAMGEIGEASETEHRKIGEIITTEVADTLICYAGETKFIYEESTIDNKYFVETPADVVNILKDKLKKDDYLFIKGSLLKHMERVIMLLNNEEVNCNVTSCPLYNNCKVCKYRYTGYKT